MEGAVSSTVSSTSLTTGTEDTNVLLITFRTIFIFCDVLCTVCGNIISTIIIHRAKGFSDSVQVLMTSLCLADLGVGLTLISSLVSSGADWWIFGDPWCKITAGLLAVCLSMSVFSLLGVSVDRLVAIRWPLRHPMLITKRRVQIGCVVLWVTSAIIAAGNVLMHFEVTVYLQVASICYVNFSPGAGGIANEVFVATVLCAVPLGTIVLIYANLLRISAGHQRRLRNNLHLQPTEASVHTNQEASLNQTTPKPTTGNKGRAALNSKALIMFLVVSLGFALCWVPHFAMRLYGAMTGGPLPAWLQLLYVWLPMSNSFWNVIIYTLMNGSFRREVIKLLRCVRCCLRRRIVPQTNESIRGEHPTRLALAGRPRTQTLGESTVK
ncbi:beta-2 adrenergic receptor-like [Patiria miniata]|uniref:G-protein coupled receptors family 1 profile domain-containing protein n=1 Tax=Patiria miniata TaxID=46514 RepID=A0A914AIP7_PATMI|nr:beta-2 adrenergic receptor-like [Patiria miniata]